MLDVFVYSIVSGVIGTTLGAVIVLLTGKSNETLIAYLLAFAAGVMISISVFSLIPEGVDITTEGGYFAQELSILLMIAFTTVGIALTFGLDKIASYFVKRRNANSIPLHGTIDDTLASKQRILKAGIIIFLAIAMHNFPEGLAIGAAGAHDLQLSWTLAIALGLHNIPEGMAVAAPLLAGGISKKKILFFSFLSAVPIVIAALLGYALGSVHAVALSLALGIASGAMLYIVFIDMLPEIVAITKSRIPMFVLLLGILIGYTIVLI